MSEDARSDMTRMLQAWTDGDAHALETLTPIVYRELRQIAHRRMSLERDDHTLQTTALINEAYLRLIDWKNARWQNRTHFFAACAQIMRRILVDSARARGYVKRGGPLQKISLDTAIIASEDRDPEIIALHEALEHLATLDPRKSQVVELRFFGGLELEEIAEVLKVSRRTVINDWNFAKAWLHREICGSA